MKVERFIIEYANYTIKATEADKLMNEGIKKEIIRRANYAVNLRRAGLVTADDAIKIIGGFVDGEKDMSQYME